MKPIADHLIRAIDLSLDVGRHLSTAPTLEHVLEAMSCSAFLLDNRGRISFANQAAEALLAEADGLLVTRPDPLQLVAADSRDNRALGKAIRTSIALALRQEQDWTGTVLLRRPSGRPSLAGFLTPLLAPFHPFGIALGSRACVLVQFPDAADDVRHIEPTLRRVFKLSAAQARVAVLIARGVSTPEAARMLGVSTTTVKTHLSHCFDKLEVRSQVELTRIVATLPAQILR